MNTKMWFYIIGAVVLVILGVVIYQATKGGPSAAINSNTGANATSSATQVEAQEVSVGTGAEAVPGATVSVLYVGQLQDGTVFDSSEMHNNEPYTFTLGSTEPGSPIPGFQIGVNGMKVGGERIMAIPASLAYGDQEIKDANGKVVIAANSTLVFDVKLVNVVPPTQ